ncbi:prohibitin [Perkinsela sp. CCAP 1560/4]|nr:prohibitin [Perkinsela sp. CCAP 1560/4]KNH04178.1 prohibitin [Perkinsela sp. CCAP 1560/4]|eukprot:KNH03607.1 prohibitin [Perkinsela sp. CCAP 1560/4]
MFGKALTAVGIGAAIAGTCTYVVHPGECAVVYSMLTGIRDKTYSEGIHFRVPMIEMPKLFDIRLRPRVISTMTGTKDLQMVNIKLRVLFRPQVGKLPAIYRELGQDYDEKILPSIGNEIMKAVVAEHNAEELIVNREKVSERIRTCMSEKALKEFNIVLDDISLMDISFGKEFMQAVEQKQVAQQEAERFKFVVLENEQRKKAAVIRAEGEANAARLISHALTTAGSGLVELRRIEAAKEISQDLLSSPNVSFVPKNGSVILGDFFNALKPRVSNS